MVGAQSAIRDLIKTEKKKLLDQAGKRSIQEWLEPKVQSQRQYCSLLPNKKKGKKLYVCRQCKI